MNLMIILVFVISGARALAHGDKKHANVSEIKTHHEADQSQSLNEKQRLLNIYGQINTSYMQNVKPLFLKACYDCHSDKTVHPWYYSIPGVQQFIDHKIFEAKKHLDFSKDFPFVSHDSPLEDLVSIKKTVLGGEMPPLTYRLMHADSKLRLKEKQAVAEWVNNSLERLK